MEILTCPATTSCLPASTSWSFPRHRPQHLARSGPLASLGFLRFPMMSKFLSGSHRSSSDRERKLSDGRLRSSLRTQAKAAAASRHGKQKTWDHPECQLLQTTACRPLQTHPCEEHATWANNGVNRRRLTSAVKSCDEFEASWDSDITFDTPFTYRSDQMHQYSLSQEHSGV